MRTRPTDIGLLVLLGAIWGTSFMAIKAGLSHFDPIWFAALRYDIAALTMVLVVLVMGQARALRPTSSRQWAALFVTGTLNMMAYHALLFWGQQYTTSAIAAVIVGLNPVAATVFSRAMLPGERLNAFGLVGLVLGIIGLAVLVGLKPGQLLDARGIGELAVAGAIISFAFGTVIAKRLDHHMPVVPFTAVQMAIGAIELHLISLFTEGITPTSEWTLSSTTSMLYLAVIASALGFYLFFTLLNRIGPIRTTAVSYIAPAFAALAGWVALGEALELRAVYAYVLIVSGFLLVMRRPGAPRVEPGTPPAPLPRPPRPPHARGPPRIVWDD